MSNPRRRCDVIAGNHEGPRTLTSIRGKKHQPVPLPCLALLGGIASGAGLLAHPDQDHWRLYIAGLVLAVVAAAAVVHVAERRQQLVAGARVRASTFRSSSDRIWTVLQHGDEVPNHVWTSIVDALPQATADLDILVAAGVHPDAELLANQLDRLRFSFPWLRGNAEYE